MSVDGFLGKESQRLRRGRIREARRALADLAIELVEEVEARPEDPFGALEGIFDRMRAEVEVLREEEAAP